MHRFGSLGNIDAFLTLSRPRYRNTTRSSPIPAPAWGLTPCLNDSMYVLRPSPISIPLLSMIFVTNSGSWHRCAPEQISFSMFVENQSE